jgi:hypothetical protein
VEYVTTTFSPTLRVSASIPSGRVNVFPSDRVIASPFVSTLAIVPVAALAKAPVEDAAANINAVAMTDLFIFFFPVWFHCDAEGAVGPKGNGDDPEHLVY